LDPELLADGATEYALRGQPARHSLPEFQTTGRSWEDDDEYENEVLDGSEPYAIGKRDLVLPVNWSDQLQDLEMMTMTVAQNARVFLPSPLVL
jgi:hypothetical protein